MPSKKTAPAPPGEKETPVSVRSIDRQDEMLWIAGRPPLPSDFPPCIKAIIDLGKAERGEEDGAAKGRHRMAAVLASFLGQAGYSREEAKLLWLEAAGGVEERIFEEWFARMHCPKCRALQRQSKGYPDMGVADLQICRPDDRCSGFEGPVEYACRIASEDDRKSGSLLRIRTRYAVRILDWTTGKESEIELTAEEKSDLDGLLAELAKNRELILTYAKVKVRGRLHPKFYLRMQEGPRRQMLSDII
ncbi:MAG TPA: hypothetical protein PLN19_06340 [Methanothrix sp.]|jgi:hypothetical protein|nr:hypothetical protein [Methanothrix sp.]HOV82349.1 hypothetical protein [Methanothrix sp.]HPC90440.1 hypothetical protein [Methanothrix sp.]HQE87875.1 hypothetical protein [Methanothrix sp.]HRS85229.1 hypothetical protein [Methanothrix sp.]